MYAFGFDISKANVMQRQFITRTKLLERLGGISPMTLWRWEHDEKLGFPKGIEIRRRKYYDLLEIEAWERNRAIATALKAA